MPTPVNTYATSGFEALRTLDDNGDGQFDAQDTAFAQVQLWQDLNQDGISQAGELRSLADHGIVRIGLTPDSSTVNLGNGNTVTGTATVTTRDGSTTQVDSVDLTGSTRAGNLNLADNPFYREFTDTIPITEAASALPDMGGAGVLRDLREATSLGTPQAQALTQAVQAFAAADSRDAQRALLDTVLSTWAGTAGRVPSNTHALAGDAQQLNLVTEAGTLDFVAFGASFGATLDAQGMNWRGVTGNVTAQVQALGGMLQQSGAVLGWGVKTNGTSAGLKLSYSTQSTWSTFEQGQPVLASRIAVLEQFNGVQAFSSDSFLTHVVNGAGQDTYVINMPQANADLFNQAYEALQESVYGALVMQTRLRSYLDAVELVVDETGIRFDAAGIAALLEAKRGADERNALIDLIELNRYAQDTLGAVGFDGISTLRGWIDALPSDSPLHATLAELHVLSLSSGAATAKSDLVLGTAAANSLAAGGGDDLMFGGDGNDVLSGDAGNDSLNGGDGDDYLRGGEGNDILQGSNGNDTLDGGAGNDTYHAGAGNNVVLFGRGDGQDYISYNNDSTPGKVNTVRIKDDVAASEVTALRSGADLVLRIAGSGDVLRVSSFFDGDDPNSPYNPIQQVVFADGTTWDIETLKAMVIVGTEDSQTLIGFTGNDQLSGLGGNDTISGQAGNDTVDGGVGNDTLDGGNGDDYLQGGEGNDLLQGSNGNDTLDGGAGNDTYYVGAGNNVVLFGRGDGQDYISYNNDSTPGKVNTVRIKDDVAASEVTALRSGADLVLRIAGSGDALRVSSFFDGDDPNSPYNPIQKVVFADGTTWDIETLKAMVIVGTEDSQTLIGFAGNDQLSGLGGNDTISGQAGNDTVDGGSGNDTLDGGNGDDYLLGGEGNDLLQGSNGNDTLDGGAGNDTYYTGAGNNEVLFGRGDGQDYINYNYDATAGKVNTVRIKEGVVPSEVTATRSGSSLVLRIAGGGDVLTVGSFFEGDDPNSPYNPIQQVVFADGTTWGLSTLIGKSLGATDGNDTLTGLPGNDQLNGLGGNDTINGQAGNDTVDGGAGNDTLDGGNGNDYLLGGEGNDTLQGSNGNDTLDGGAGNDTYYTGVGNNEVLFGRGDGQDYINYNYDSTPGKVNTVRIKDGVAVSEVIATRLGADLVLRIAGSGDVLRVSSFFDGDDPSSPYNPIQQIVFADGATWGIETIKAMVIAGAEDSQALTGFTGNDQLSGLGGNDTINGQAGNDTVDGGAGNDTLDGGNGDDYLLGGEGNDLLQGSNGNDTLDGGAGNDTYYTGAGNNVVLFGRGDGQDYINYNYDSTPGKVNTVRIKDGVAVSEVTATRSGADLVLRIAGSGDALRVSSFFDGDDPSSPYNPIQQVVFADGTTWDIATLKAMVIVGTEDAQMLTGYTGNDQLNGLGGNDTINGQAGNDTLDGGIGNDTLDGGNGDDYLLGGEGNDLLQGSNGNDTLDGGGGNDTYYTGVGNNEVLFGRGDGQDYINYNYDSTPGKVNTVRIKDGVAVSEVTATRSGADLVLRIAGSGDVMRVSSFFDSDDPNSPYNPIQQIVFADGTTWDIATLKAMVIVGTEDAQTLTGYTGNDQLNGLGGNDTINGQAGNDTVDGGAGNDTLDGGNGDDYLLGGDGNDLLQGSNGNDTLDGGAGNDTHYTGVGNNVILFGRGDGQDYINYNYDATPGKVNTVRIKDDVAASEVTATRSGADLLLRIAGSGDVMRVSSFFDGDDPSSPYNPIQQVVFADGTTWGIETIKAMVIAGTEDSQTLTGFTGNDQLSGLGGNDTISGHAGNDTVDGGAGNDTLDGGNGDDYLLGGEGNDLLQGSNGNDTLDGGAGNDTYYTGAGNNEVLFGRGDGQDYINYNYDATAGKVNTVRIKEGVVPSDVTVTRSGPSLVLRLAGGGDVLTVGSFFDGDDPNSPYNPIQQVAFADGVTWDIAAIKKLAFSGTGGNDSIAGTTAADVMSGAAGADILNGLAGNDTLDGGAGTDTLNGGAGNDTYVFTSGTGADTINGDCQKVCV